MNLLTFYAESGGLGDYWIWIFMAVLLVGMGGFYFYSSKKNKQKQAEALEMAAKLAPGDKVKTIGGIVGEIVSINSEEGTITIKTGTSTMVFDKQAVYSIGYFEAMENRGKKEQTAGEVPHEAEIYKDVAKDSEPTANTETVVDRADTKKSKNTKKSS